MSELVTRAIEYDAGGARLVGYFAAAPGGPKPGLILVHDAFGVSPAMKAAAERTAALGYAVLLADLWGDGQTPRSDAEIGPLIGATVANHERWIARLRAAHETLLAQPEVDGAKVGAFGYCFGGSSVLEYARAGGDVAGVACFHPGLDTVSTDWQAAKCSAKVLVLTGDEDPFAPPSTVRALQDSLSAAGIDWEFNVYGQAKHAFTNPHADEAGKPNEIAYDARADARSWAAFTGFLEELFGSERRDA